MKILRAYGVPVEVVDTDSMVHTSTTAMRAVTAPSSAFERLA